VSGKGWKREIDGIENGQGEKDDANALRSVPWREEMKESTL
jgi:hypothetical protein